MIALLADGSSTNELSNQMEVEEYHLVAENFQFRGGAETHWQ